MEDLKSNEEGRLLGPDFVFGRLEDYLEGSKNIRRAELLLDVYNMHKPEEYTDAEWEKLQSDYPAPSEVEMEELRETDTVARDTLARDLKIEVSYVPSLLKAYNALKLSRALGRERLYAQDRDFAWDLYTGAKALASRTGETYEVSTGEGPYSPTLLASPTIDESL